MSTHSSPSSGATTGDVTVEAYTPYTAGASGDIETPKNIYQLRYKRGSGSGDPVILGAWSSVRRENEADDTGKIIARGGSAGGMLMGAVANMAPHLFGGIIAQVPFVDVLTTMLDDSLPLTPPEWNEWGNPIASAEAYRTIAAYSPYDNVEAKAYPPIFITAGLTDPRVTYWEPAKWCARLRALKTDDNLLLLKTNMDAGHGGASGRFDSLKETAEAYAFALEVTG